MGSVTSKLAHLNDTLRDITTTAGIVTVPLDDAILDMSLELHFKEIDLSEFDRGVLFAVLVKGRHLLSESGGSRRKLLQSGLGTRCRGRSEVSHGLNSWGFMTMPEYGFIRISRSQTRNVRRVFLNLCAVIDTSPRTALTQAQENPRAIAS